MGNFDKIMRENLGKISKGLMKYLLPENAEKATPMLQELEKQFWKKKTDNLFLIQAEGGKGLYSTPGISKHQRSSNALKNGRI